MNDLAQIREACEKATPGPWSYEDSWGRGLLAVDVLYLGDEERHALLREPSSTPQSNARYDLAFMAASREWVPALVGELEAARTELAAFKRELLSIAALPEESYPSQDELTLVRRYMAIRASARELLGADRRVG